MFHIVTSASLRRFGYFKMVRTKRAVGCFSSVMWQLIGLFGGYLTYAHLWKSLLFLISLINRHIHSCRLFYMSYFTRTSFIYEGGPFKICVHVSNLGVSFIQIAGLHWTPCKTIDGSQQKQYGKTCYIISHRMPIYDVFTYMFCLNLWVLAGYI